ncbi:MAG: hydroxyisourate hydrolase [Sporichthyaceae bacterium]
MSLSTHVLDTTTGRPAAGVTVTWGAESVQTDADGRARFAGNPGVGVHSLTFATGDWFAAAGVAAFHPRVVVEFEVRDAAEHHHVPLLLSPFAYSTYRGS